MALSILKYRTSFTGGTSNNRFLCPILADDRVVNLRPDEANIRNAFDDDPITLPVTVFSTLNRDVHGVLARGVVVREIVEGTDAELTGSRLFIPVFRFNVYDRWHIGYHLSIGNIDYIITGKRPETLRS